MKRRLIATVLAALSMMQNSALADILTDLPNPGDGMEAETQPQTTPPVAQQQSQEAPPAAPALQRQYKGDVNVKQISRKKDGETRKITFRQSLSLLSFEVKVQKSRVKIHEAALILTNGQRVDVRELRNLNVLETGSVVSSGNLNLRDAVAAIEIRGESYSGESDISLSAISDVGVPHMTAQEPVPPVPSPSAPVKPAESTVIQVGDTVLYSEASSDYVGTVQEIFRSGKATVRFKGYSGTSVVHVTKLGRALNCHSDLCAGERVIFDGSEKYVGTVRAVYSNGRAQIKFDGYSDTSFIGISRLAKGVSSKSGLRLDDRVLLSTGTDDYVGKVMEIFSDGTTKIKFDGYSGYSFVAAKKLAKVVDSVGAYRPGSRVLFSNGYGPYAGTVREMFADGTASIRFDGYGSLSFINVKKLGLETQCHGDICRGSRVVYKDQYVGSVLNVYSNGSALVKFDGYAKEYVQTRELSR